NTRSMEQSRNVLRMLNSGIFHTLLYRLFHPGPCLARSGTRAAGIAERLYPAHATGKELEGRAGKSAGTGCGPSLKLLLDDVSEQRVILCRRLLFPSCRRLEPL